VHIIALPCHSGMMSETIRLPDDLVGLSEYRCFTIAI